jgi:hypothetical protein
MTVKTTPLYVVCSPFRCVGKTLISRLLVERRVIDGRPVAAFDLADEAPQLADYQPDVTTVAAIDDTGDQMTFFERLIADETTATVVDVSHRTFKAFFTVAQKIGFFDEARRRGFEPVVLFVIDPDPRGAKAYGMLRRWFTQAPILPVHNQIAAPANAGDGLPALEIPVLGLSLRALVDRPEFSFLQLWQSPANGLSGALDDELLAWAEQIFAQLRDLEISMGCEDQPGRAAAPISTRAPRRQRQREARPRGGKAARDAQAAPMVQRAADAPKEVLQFAPKHRPRVDSETMDHSGRAIVAMLHQAADRSCDNCDQARSECDQARSECEQARSECDQARSEVEEVSRKLLAAADRIAALEKELEHFQDRAVRAETWLQMIQREVEKLMPSTAAMRPKSTR